MDWKTRAIEIRAEALADIVSSRQVAELPAFIAFRSADEMVVRMGGESLIGSADSKANVATMPKIVVKRQRASSSSSNADIALKVLSERNEPMATAPLMQASEDQGAFAGGKDPINNFRSALSRDERLYSLRFEGANYWWITGMALPEGWETETAGANLPFAPAAPVHDL